MTRRYIVTPPGFNQPGQAKTATGEKTGRLRINVRDRATGRPTPCRLNVVGPDGHFYQPAPNPLSPYSLTGQWPKTGKGNREGKAPIRYLGRFFYTTGEVEVAVPAGKVRVEAWKGFEYRPVVKSVEVAAGQTKPVRPRARSHRRRWPRSAITRAIRTCTSPARPRPTTRSSSTCWRPRTSISARSWLTTSRPARTPA